MSTFNKLFTGSVLTAALLLLVHTGSWAWRSSRAVDAAQALAVAPVMVMSANGISGFPSRTLADSCARASHADAP